ncbi:hypothetical protein EDB86DRAFT_2776747, partial [Lactarius hatsudake]
GPGTGLVTLALGPFVREYTSRDIPALVPLLRKNILSAPAPASAIMTVLNWTLPALYPVDVRRADVPDVLLVVDRVFHPILVCLVLAMLTALAMVQHTSVVAEMPTEDVLREFLQG